MPRKLDRIPGGADGNRQMTDQGAASNKLIASGEHDPVVLTLARIIVAVEGRRRVAINEGKHLSRSADLAVESKKR